MPTARWTPVVSAILTTALVVLLALFFVKAGGLWRDEANSASFAENLPTLHWTDLQYDSFPAGWPLLLRGWIDVAGTSDLSYRAFGLIAGLSVVLGVWWIAVSDRARPPVVALMLLAGHGATIRTVSSVRAYGVAVVAMLLLIASLRRLIDQSTGARHLLVLLWSLCAVHLLYLNCALVFAAIVAGAATVALERRFRDAVLLLASGATAAVTMLIYLPVIRASSGWIFELQTDRYTLGSFWGHLLQTISFHSRGLTLLWGSAGALGLAAGAIGIRKGSGRKPRQSFIFGMTLLASAIAAYAALLIVLRLATSWWYYVPLLVVIAVAADMLYGATLPERMVATWSLIVSAVIFPLAVNVATMRQTNVDLIAAEVAKTAAAGDLVVIDPWFVGVSYARYHHAPAPWQTLPPMSTHRWHQWDEAAAKERDIHAADTLYSSVTTRLNQGGRIYFVSDGSSHDAMTHVLETRGAHLIRQFTTTRALPERLILQVWGRR